MNPLSYPETRRVDLVESLHGRDVPDPYRWLEDTDSDETAAWVAAQNQVTFGHLETLPGRAPLRARLTALWDYPKQGLPHRRGDRRFFLKNDGLQQQSVLYWQDGDDGPATVLLDPNTLADDGTVALTDYRASEDGTLLVYSLAAAGSDWNELRVREVETGQDRDDHIEWVKFSNLSWTHDGAGFFYSRYPEPDPDAKSEQALFHQELRYHRLGTAQSDDLLVCARPDEKEWGFSGSVSEDGQTLVIGVWRGTDPKNGLFLLPLAEFQGGEPEVDELLTEFDAAYHHVLIDGRTLYLRTDLDAPRGKLIAIDLDRPAPEHWRTVIPEAEDTLESVGVVGERFLCEWLHHAHSRVTVHTLDGAQVAEVPLPGIGTVAGFGGRRTDVDTFFSFTSFISPASIHRFEVAPNRVTLVRPSAAAIDPERFVTTQVFVTSKDGTQVPLFLSHLKTTRLDDAPVYLYGYGGFNIPLTPTFRSVAQAVWMELGGVYAVACLRGGSEYGEAWHEAGCRHNKQNVFDDFIACAEHLIAEGVTSTPRLAIGGGSNGGLLVGACITQRPDLFGAAVPSVGVLDMLRFHTFTIGWAWISDYGDPDDAADFEVLLRYSPLHALEPGTAYPATLITTGDHDDRVVPAHSFKFAAALQAAQGGPAPTLIRIETRAGHGLGKPTEKLIEEAADVWAFIADALGVEVPADLA